MQVIVDPEGTVNIPPLGAIQVGGLTLLEANRQISERAREGVMVTERMTQDLAQGRGGERLLSATEVHDWKRYQTRVMSSANRVNLDFEDAAPELVAGLTQAVAGIF